MSIAEFKVQLEKSEYWLLLLAELHPEAADIGAARSETGELVRIFDKIRHSTSQA